MADATADGLMARFPLSARAWPKGEGYRLESWSFATLHLAPIPSDGAEAIRSIPGLDTCPGMLRAAEFAGGAVLRVGPGEALIVGEIGPVFHEMAGFEKSGFIEISHSLVGLHLSGAYTEAILALGCPIDMHIRAFPVGMVTRTLFGKFDLVLWRTAPTGFRLLVARSASLAFLAYLDSIFPHAPV